MEMNDEIDIVCPTCGQGYKIRKNGKHKDYYCVMCLESFTTEENQSFRGSKLGRIAVLATELIQGGNANNPRDAWDMAVTELYGKTEINNFKGFPRDAYLGLCEEGEIEGVLPGEYTGSKKNKKYALKALKILRKHLEFEDNVRALVQQKKVNKDIMSIVIALWREGMV